MNTRCVMIPATGDATTPYKYAGTVVVESSESTEVKKGHRQLSSSCIDDFSYFFRNHDNDDDGDPPAIESTKEGTVISTKLRRHDAQ